MAVESAADLEGFFNPNEFGAEALLITGAGSFPVAGIPDSFAEEDRLGATSNSSRSPFLAGAADFSVTELQFQLPWHSVLAAGAVAEDSLQITTGTYAGLYRIKEVKRDGEQCRLMLNKK